ncbi:hypothetical protein JCM8547_001286 [Rhodosporidiobolus lusitaniae]
MVSFVCNACCDTLKKPKLDQHAQRCRGAQFSCIDCNTDFQGTSYRSHTSCVTEEERYHKSVYKAPKGKGKKNQQGQQENQPPAPAAPAPAPAVNEKKREREEEPAPAVEDEKKAEEKKAEEKKEGEKVEEEPSKKKSKKEKKDKKEKKKDKAPAAEEEEASAPAEEPKAEEKAEESLAAFLTSTVTPLLSISESISLVQLREQVLAAVKEKGRKEGVEEVEKRLFEGLKVGGKKQRVKVEFE